MTQSLEDYLEAIYVLTRGRKVVRVKEVSEKLGVKKPSVIRALRELKNAKLVSQERYGFIELTAHGRTKALSILKKHQMLKAFLVRELGVSDRNAEEDACSMEHFLSGETLEKIAQRVGLLESGAAVRSVK